MKFPPPLNFRFKGNFKEFRVQGLGFQGFRVDVVVDDADDDDGDDDDDDDEEEEDDDEDHDDDDDDVTFNAQVALAVRCKMKAMIMDMCILFHKTQCFRSSETSSTQARAS